MQEFRKSWATSTKLAGFEGRLFHDLRRSCARNLIRSGVSQSVAMKITGHATSSMFSRYDITNTEDITDAMERVLRYNKAEQERVVSIAR